MIEKAKKNDLSKIMEIIRFTVEEMKGYNNTQWDESYPQEKDFLRDIDKEELYLLREGEQVKGFICVNYIEPSEYEGLKWSSDKKSMVIHRMAVNPNFRRQGVGMSLMKFAEEMAFENDVEYLKTDTYSVNKNMNALFKRCGYTLVGEMSFLGKEKPFYCYEKLLKK